jgi:hypothetical protein
MNTYIQQGQVAYLANYIDTTNAYTGVYGGMVTRAGLPDTFFRVNPQVSRASVVYNLSNSSWDGMKVDIGKRFSQGTYIQFNYTLGKGLTDYTGGQTLYQDFRDNAHQFLDKSLQQYDSTHIVQGNVIWELPWGTGKKWMNSAAGWQNAILGGWQLNAITQFTTARPLTITSNYSNFNTGRASTANYSGTDRNVTAQVIRTGTTIMALTPAQIAEFSTPPAGSPGGTPFYAFRGPHFFNVDTSMFKNFKVKYLGEQGALQFRVEAFNVLNHENFALPNGNINGGTFGAISSGYSPRILQFALKLSF